jgi:zinc transporter, ZIP family
MMPFSVLLFVLFPVGAMILGGVIATVRTPGKQLGSALQHFAAGTVFAAVAVELLPDLVSKHAPLATIVGFSVGVALMLAIRAFTSKREQEGKEQERGIAGLVTAVGVDITLDGLLIGIGFVAGAKQGLLLTIALTLELLSLGLATVTASSQTGASRRKSMVTVTGLALLVLLGAVIGVIGLSHATEPILDAVLAFGVAALLYLVTEELLVEAHEVPETPLITSIFFVGFLTVLMIALLT